MASILILFAHPKLEQSRVNRQLIDRAAAQPGVTVHDLYDRYPDFNVQIDYEKRLLERHEVILWQHPFYWYGGPPLLKQWIDLVLEHGWAYGEGGDALLGKQIMNVITTGGSRAVYCAEGKNNFSVNEFLRPYEQTARLCGMHYLPPFAVMGTYGLSDGDIAAHADRYADLLGLLREGVGAREIGRCDLINDLPELQLPPS